MNTFGEQLLRRISLWTALCAALLFALPATAGAQLMDPILEQYAPSTEQIDKKVKEGDSQEGGGQAEGDTQGEQAGAEGGAVPTDGGEVEDGSEKSDGGGAVGGSGGGGGTAAGGGGGIGSGGATGESPSGADDAGLDSRLLGNVPLTWFDF